MARRTRVRVEVYDSVLMTESAPGGDSYKHLKATNRLIFRTAVAWAPVGSTGDLKASHVNAGVRKVGRYAAAGSVNNTAEHALWVHDGTQGPIRPRTSRYLRLPAGGGHGVIYASSVSGQRANPWLFRAGQFAAAIMGGRARRVRVQA